MTDNDSPVPATVGNRTYEQVQNWPLEPRVTSGEAWREYVYEFVKILDVPNRFTLEGLLQRDLTLPKFLYVLRKLFIDYIADVTPAALARNEPYDFNAGCYVFRMEVPNDGVFNVGVPELPGAHYASGLVVINQSAPPQELAAGRVPWEEFIEVVFVALLRDAEGRHSLMLFTLNNSEFMSEARLNHLPLFRGNNSNLSRSFERHMIAILTIGEPMRPQPFPVLFQRAVAAGSCIVTALHAYYFRYAAQRALRTNSAVAGDFSRDIQLIMDESVALTRAFAWLYNVSTDEQKNAAFNALRSVPSREARRTVICILRNDYGILAGVASRESFAVI